MKLIIDISENDYWSACNHPEVFIGDYARAIKNGTPLPKGHGDLIDRQELINDGINKGFCDWYDEIKMADAIIEADTREQND